MATDSGFEMVPWDSKVFGIDAFEIREASAEVLAEAAGVPGHFTVRVDPLFPKKPLHESGFYYCDTLIEPYCTANAFNYYGHEKVTISEDVSIAELVAVLAGAFRYDRFHRDFNIEGRSADLRYENWLKDLYFAKNCLGLLFDGQVAGFFCFTQEKILLHALHENFRGRGLAKFFWSAACRKMFDSGHAEIRSSISAANVPVLNLYASLGFRFRNPVDIYHRLTR